MAPPNGLHLLQCMASLGEEYVIVSMPAWHCFSCCGIVVVQNVALYNTAHSWFAEVPERNVTSFAEEGKMIVSVRVKGWMVKHLFVGSM